MLDFSSRKLSLFLVIFLCSCAKQPPAKVVMHRTTSAKQAGHVSKNPYKVIVEKGDTLYAIAKRNDAEIRHLIDLNDLRPPYILIQGQTLRLPKATFHVVADGDSLKAISNSYGVDISRLAKKNNLEYPYNLTKGQKLVLPSKTQGDEPQTIVAAETTSYVTKETQVTSSAVTSSQLAPLGAVSSSELKPLGAVSSSPLKPIISNNKNQQKNITESDDTPFATQKFAIKSQAAQGKLTNNKKELAHKSEGEFASDYHNSATENKNKMANNTSKVIIADKKEDLKKTAEISNADNLIKQKTAIKTEPEKKTPVEQKVADATLSFIWPVKGNIISGFGPKKGGLYNDGINIAAKDGEPVKAAADGEVVYAGNELRGYGNMLLIKHNNGYLTSYAHTDDFLVKKGDTIKKGAVIAHVGQTGHVSSPQLHFSVRKGKKSLDPEKLLSAG